jgi:hypothetical protein
MATDDGWRKSQRSAGNGTECVEVRRVAGEVQLRDSKDPGGPWLRFDAATWRAFVADVRAGRFDG